MQAISFKSKVQKNVYSPHLKKNNEFIKTIDKHLESHVKTEYKNSHKEYLDEAISNIAKLMNTWTDQLRYAAAHRKISATLEFYMGEKIGTFIVTNFFNFMKIQNISGSNYTNTKSHDELHPTILPLATKLAFTCAWDPGHAIYQKKNLRYTFNPVSNGEFFYTCMKEQKNTDITLVSNKPKPTSIPVHSLFLCLKSQVFNSWFNGPFKEKKQEVFSLNYSTRIHKLDA